MGCIGVPGVTIPAWRADYDAARDRREARVATAIAEAKSELEAKLHTTVPSLLIPRSKRGVPRLPKPERQYRRCACGKRLRQSNQGVTCVRCTYLKARVFFHCPCGVTVKRRSPNQKRCGVCAGDLRNGNKETRQRARENDRRRERGVCVICEAPTPGPTCAACGAPQAPRVALRKPGPGRARVG